MSQPEPPRPSLQAPPARTAPTVLAGVDRAAFVVPLGERLREAGVPVSLTSLAAFSDALRVAPPVTQAQLRWVARVTLANRPRDLPLLDQVLDAVLGTTGEGVQTPVGLPGAVRRGPRDGDDLSASGDAAAGSGSLPGTGLPWYTLSPREGEEDQEPTWLPELRASAVEALAEVPFEDLDEDQLAQVGAWLERSAASWPTRLGRRRGVHATGRRVALRRTIADSRRTGWEPFRLVRTRPVPRLRPVIMLADVSQSMQVYSGAYLHVMRALARTGRAETFCFSTALTRVTPALAHHSAQVALRQAGEQVVDRYGGTRLASSLRELLTSRHGSLLRGGVLVLASDGWDSEEPDLLVRQLRRARLRAHRVIWLNPRKGAPGYQPLAGSMAAALPYCDAFLPAHTLRTALEALDAIAVPTLR